jgi:hypothetical protein
MTILSRLCAYMSVLSCAAEDPLTGAIGTRFGRNVPMSAVQPDMANLLNPNPLLVSSKLLHRRPGTDNSKVPFLNMLAGAWVQFMIHDW